MDAKVYIHVLIFIKLLNQISLPLSSFSSEVTCKSLRPCNSSEPVEHNKHKVLDYLKYIYIQ